MCSDLTPCNCCVNNRGQVVNLPPTLAASLPRPILTPLYDAGNAFSKCHAWDKVSDRCLIPIPCIKCCVVEISRVHCEVSG
jgi:hypothetical protein